MRPQVSSTIPPRLSPSQLHRVDNVTLNLLYAKGVVSAILNTFDGRDPNTETTMPTARIYEALCALEHFINEASGSAETIC